MSLASMLPYLHPFAGGFPYRGSQRLPSDPDALTYLAAVAAADGAAVEVGVATAVDDFFRGIKADGTFSAIRSACLLCGARTLAGALVPLVGAAPTNNNFVDADYNRETGLVGNGSTKYLTAGLAYNVIPSNNEHAAIVISVNAGGNRNILGGGKISPLTITRIGIISGDNYCNAQDSGSQIPQSIATGFVGVSRSQSTQIGYRLNGLGYTRAISSGVRPSVSTPYGVFCANFSDLGVSGISSDRLSFYSIGESISDLALLDARVTDLVTSIGAAL